MKKIYFLFALVVGIFCMANVNAQDLDLSVHGLNWNSNGDLNSYDAETATITYGGDWQYYGWTWAERGGNNFSKYNYFTVYYDASGLPEFGDGEDPCKIQVQVDYMDGTNTMKEGRVKWGAISVELNAEKSDQVKGIFVKSQKTGTLKLLRAYFQGNDLTYLPLNAMNLNSNGDLNSYDPETATITFGGDWQYYGWTWANATQAQSGMNFSNYETLTINFDPQGLPEFGDGTDPTKIQVEVGYMDDSKEDKEFRVFNYAASIDLQADKKNAVKYMYIKSQKPGKLRIIDAYLSKGSATTNLALSLGTLNWNSNGDLNSYDPETATITYGGDWQYYGWTWKDRNGNNFSKFKSFTVYYDASGLPEFGDGTDPTKIQVQVDYMDDTSDMKEGRNSWGSITIDLNPEKSDKIKGIFIKSQKVGTLKLLDAYFCGTVFELSLKALNLNSNGDLNSYNPETATITYGGDWQFYGWTWANATQAQNGMNFSNYETFVVNFDASGLPEFGDGTDPTKIQVEIGYMDDSKEDKEFRVFQSSASIDFQADKKNAVKYLYIKSQKPGDLKLIRAYVVGAGTPAIEDELLPIENSGDLNFGSQSTSYDGETHTVTFADDNGIRGWTIDPEEKDLSDYLFAIVEFEPVDYDVTLTAQYDCSCPVSSLLRYNVPDCDCESTTVTVPAGATRVVVTLDEAEKLKTNRIFLQTSEAGDLILKKAYLSAKDPRQPDLIVTDITWEPESPEPGAAVKFTAVVKNIGDGATPANIKHGVAFTITGISGAVSWSDSFKGADKFILPGETVELTANGGPDGSDGSWTVGKNTSYTITAQVNDNPSDGIKNESNTDNNKFSKDMKVSGKSDLIITTISYTDSDGNRLSTIKEGDKVIFRANVKNQAGMDTPSGIKHGVAFFVNDKVVSWSDDRFETIKVNEEVRLAACGGPAGLAYWVATAGDLTIKAEVNDQKEIEESDYSNNTFTTTITVTGIENLIVGGKVYIENGRLFITGYPQDSNVLIYNAIGKKIAEYKGISDGLNLNLSTGAYIVKIMNNGKPTSVKILVK